MIDSDDKVKRGIKKLLDVAADDLDGILGVVKNPDTGTYIIRDIGFDNGDGTYNMLSVSFRSTVCRMDDDEDEAEE